MNSIILNTKIRAPLELCFNVSRDADIHIQSASSTEERIVSGRTTGLFELDDIVTWEAKHLGIVQQLTVKITKMRKPYFFEDSMIKGAFKSMIHEHHFNQKDNFVVMKDIFQYEVPFGIIGETFDKIILNKYLTEFLRKRNEYIKSIAED